MKMLKKGILTAALLASGACDPCAGVLSCVGDPRISYEGVFIRSESKEPVAGVRVQVMRESGIALDPDTFFVETDSEGRFQIESEATEEGEVVADLMVFPPGGLDPYRIDDVVMRTTDVLGDGHVFPERWVVDPYIAYSGELFLRSTNRHPPTSVLTFRRTGGIEVRPDSFRGYSDGNSGRFAIEPKALRPGVLEGDLTVEIPGYKGRYAIRGLRLQTLYKEGLPRFLARYGVGPSLDYFAELYYRPSLLRAAGVEVEFQRTGGIRTTPERFVVRSDAAGRVPLRMTTEEDGEVIADITIRPPAPHETIVMRGVRLPTFDSDQGNIFANWYIGAHMPYFGLLRYDDTGEPATGVEVEVRRLGGIAVEQESVITRTNQFGTFSLELTPRDTGDVTVEVIARPGGGYQDLTVSGLKLRATEADVSSVLFGEWRIQRR